MAGLRLRVAAAARTGPPVSGHGISGRDRAARAARRARWSRPCARGARRPRSSRRPAAPTSDTRPLQTVVCLPLRSPRSGADGERHLPARPGRPLRRQRRTSAEPFSGDALRAAEALARHAALAIENAQLFEREQHTIEELQKAQKQLLQSEKLATIGQMAAGIAHELNTPLTYIMGNLELLELQDL